MLGEIVAWRCWLVRPDGFIRSCAADAVWAPGEPMTGDIGKDGTGSLGIHAWKTARGALTYGTGQGPNVIGKVALWGEVVEHAEGYRAEFAKPVSFEWLMGEGAPPAGQVEGIWAKIIRRRVNSVAIDALEALRGLYFPPAE